MRLLAKPRACAEPPPHFVVVGVCEVCILPVVDELRAVATAEESPESVTRLLELVALLEDHGLAIDDAHKGGLAGLAGIRRGLLVVLDELERHVLCSGCLTEMPESRCRVLPWWNAEVERYVEAFRCDTCFPSSIADTITKFESSSTTAEIDQIGSLLKDHLVFLHEWLRGDDPATVRPLMAYVLRELAAGSIELKIGRTVPIPIPR